MRTFVALLAIASTAAVAGHVFAAGPELPAPPRTIPTPELRVVLPPSIVSATRTPVKGGLGAPSIYAEGTLSYDVEISNPPQTPLTTELVVSLWDVPAPYPEIARVPVNVPAGGRETVTYVAPGLKDGCSPTRHRLTLVNGYAQRTLVTTPSCTFTVTGDDPMERMTPDNRIRAREGKLTYHTPVVTPAMVSCGGPMGASVRVKNNSSAGVSGHLQLDGPRDSDSSPPTPFTIGIGKEAGATIAYPAFKGNPGAYVLNLRSSSSATPVHQPNFSLRVARSCRIDIALER